MKTIFPLEDLIQLLEYSNYPSISLYMPTGRTGNIPEDQIRLKNLLKEAKALLLKYGLRASDAIELLEPIRKLIDDLDFWKHQEEGLAIFLSPEQLLHYRLPADFSELVVVANRFHLKPLIPLITDDVEFFILAISQNHVRLLKSTQYYTSDITPEDLSDNLTEVLQSNQREKQHQYHTTDRAYPPTSHGQGTGKDFNKVNILQYFQRVDRILHNLFAGEQAPLVIAAVDYLHPLYQEANTYGYLIDNGLKGNPESLSEKELREQAWPVVSSYIKENKEKALEGYYEAKARGLTANRLEQVVLSAYDGRVATLFFSIGVQKWGTVNPLQRKIVLQKKRGAGAQDLLDFASVHTLIKGGMVYGIEPENMPESRPIAAILRY